jgi:hypothetical protein
MFKTGSAMIDAEHAFTRASRAGRRAALLRAVRRDSEGAQLPVLSARHRAHAHAGIREIPIDAIAGTLEPARAAQFDAAFRPIRRALRRRWERIWMAEERGAMLPPISVVPVGAVYAVRDGHHRVSVARARGAIAIDGIVEAF